MATNEKTDELYWRAYVKAIVDRVGPSATGNSRVVFIASEQNRSVSASRYIPMAVTNEQVYLAANSLLDPEDPVYNPTISVGYFEKLQEYLSYVEIGGRDPSEGAKLREEKAKRAMDTEQAIFNTEEQNAWTLYIADPNPHKSDFVVWARNHASPYTSARVRLQAARSEWRIAMRNIAGPMGEAYAIDTTVFEDFANMDHAVPGFSMPCKNMQILDVNKAIQMSKETQTGDVVEEPLETDCFWRPEYAIDPQYRSKMDEWAWEFDNSRSHSQSLTIADGDGTSWSKYGFSDVGGKAGVNLLGLFRVGVKHGESTKWEKVESDYSSGSVEFELRWKKMSLFNVHAGRWDIPDIRRKYPQTRDDIPEKTKQMVRPTQLLCGSGIGLSAKLSGTMHKSFSDKVEKARRTGGGISIAVFGFSASLIGASVGGSDTTHTASWSSSTTTGELSIEPTPLAGTCNLLGVVGEKMVS